MVKLPHELVGPENAHLVPLSSKGDRLRSFRITYNPELDKEKRGGKSAIKADLSSHSHDPRDRNARKRGRKELRLLSFKWDQHSTRPKPPPPPHSIVISGFSPLMTLPQIVQFVRPFGRTNKVDLKIDSSGQSTGVCFVSFTHDYDENLKLLPDVVEAKAQRGDLIAKEVRAKYDGQKFHSHDAIRVTLDDADGTGFRKTYRDLLAKKIEAANEAMRKAAQSIPTSSASAVPSNSATTTMRPPEPPKAPKSMVKLSTNGSDGDSFSSMSPYSRQRPSSGTHLRDAVSSRSPYSRLSRGYDEGDHARQSADDRHTSSHRSSQSRLSPNSPHHQADRRGEGDDTRATLERLIRNDRPYAFVPRIRSSNINTEAITKSFSQHRPEWIKQCDSGWFVAFRGRGDASRARNVLDGSTVSGFKITVEVSSPEDAERALSRRHERRQEDRSRTMKETEEPQKVQWTDAELIRDSKLLLLYDLGHAFMRDVRSRVLNRLVTDLLLPDRPGGKLLLETPSKLQGEMEEFELDIDLTAERPKTFNRAAREEQKQRKLALQREAERLERQAEVESAGEESDEKEEEAAEKESRKKSSKPQKGLKKPKASTVYSDDATTESELESVKKKKEVKKVPRPPSPLLDPYGSGLAEEEEDLYFCRKALERMQGGETLDDIARDIGVMDVNASDESPLPSHASGCARTEGFYRIPPAEKGRHLADRNLGSDEIIIAPSSIVGLASARDNRADSRRFVQGIEQHKKETATDTDILKFNQLRSRKKQLKFAKSPIHDWGLYAMETIPAGDMVIEYVGEIVRQQVADEREKMYERQGNFSTYLFRVDDDIVVDATKKGNIARLMNHCCTPNCNAKILTLNGEKRIVLYAKQTILPGQELTYDYKFQATGDEEDAIACLCGSSGCRGFL